MEGFVPPKPSDLPKGQKYIFDPESSKNSRIPPDKLAIALLKYDVISFDIFDTLILRPFTSPHDVFLLLSSKYKETNFHSIRILAEEVTRAKNKGDKDTHEINIYDIYQEMAKYINIDPVRGAELEIETEMDICFANPYMKLVYNIVRERNREIIAISDMYIPKEWMLKILHKCGYDYFADIFISCDYDVNKRDSKLFQIAQKKIGCKKTYIHMGDSGRGDVAGSKKAGMEQLSFP